MNRVLNIRRLTAREKFEMQTTFMSRLRKFKSIPNQKQLSQGEVAMVTEGGNSYLIVKQGKQLIKYTGEVIE